MAETTDAASQSLKKPTPISSGETEPKTWSAEDRKLAREKYWINIHAPDCSLEDINTFLKNADMQTLFIALCKHNICIHKDYIKWIDENPTVKVSYEINQQPIL